MKKLDWLNELEPASLAPSTKLTGEVIVVARSTLRALLALAVCAASAAPAVAADDPGSTAPPAPGTTEYYEAEKARYEAQKAATDAQIAASIPAPSTPPPGGTVTFREGDTGTLGRWQAYRAVQAVGAAIANGIGAGINENPSAERCAAPSVLVTSRESVVAMAAERLWFREEVARQQRIANSDAAQLAGVTSNLDATFGSRVTPESAPLLVADAALRSIGSIASYFKSDYQIKGEVYSPSDLALLAAVAGGLPTGCAVVEGILLPREPTDSLARLIELGTTLYSNASTASQVKARVATLGTRSNLAEVQKRALADADRQLQELNASIASGLGFHRDTFSRSTPTSASLIERVLIADSSMPESVKWVLVAKVVDGGSTTVSRSGLLTRSRMTSIGSVSAAYLFANAATGAIEKSGIERVAAPSDLYLSEACVDAGEGARDKCRFLR